MRIKVTGHIIEKINPNKRNYTHGIYSMIINRVNPKIAESFHTKNKDIRLFSFTNICLNGESAHFYVTGEETFLNQYIENIVKNPLVRIEDMIININGIELLDELKAKDVYTFKTKVIINTSNNGNKRLLSDINVMEERIRANAVKKATLLGKTGDISVKVIHPVKNVEQYKNGHIFSWKCYLQIQGDYDVVNTIYHCGVGENTSTGHGFMWEV